MRYSIFFILLSFVLSACSSDDDYKDNPYLIDQRFQFQLHLSLPQYEQLNFPGNHIVIPQVGLNGVVIFNMNNDMYYAYELSDPNHQLRDCSAMSVDQLEATCSCQDGNVYSIITGQPIEGGGIYAMKPYRVERLAESLIISN